MRPKCSARTTTYSLLLAFLASLAGADEDPSAHPEDHKVPHFVTEPNIKAIPWTITSHDPRAIAPGYWFVAPLINSRLLLPENREYAPDKTGAQIYDRNGDLVWSMQDQPNARVQTFQPALINGEQRLSLVVQSQTQCFGLVMDDHFQEIAKVVPKAGRAVQDFHELHLNSDGKTAILGAKFIIDDDETRATSSGFQEVDLSTGNVTFQWDARSARIGPDETEGQHNLTGDSFHLNSVDKNSEGDFLVSSRHTSAVYKISGKDGSILWRLGGLRSDFTLDPGVDFHWQHDARFRFENATHTMISLLDNAASGRRNAEQAQPSGKIILVNHESMTASLLRHFPRPGGLGSRKMGNLQTLGEDPTISNVLINWASPGGISEFDSDGRLVLEATLAGGGVTSYRVFKSPFVGRPLTLPVLKVLSALTGPNGEGLASTFYMSWNGATELRSWKIYISEEEYGPPQLMAEIPKQGFEAAWTMESYQGGFAFVEALDADGKVLGKSNATLIDGPHGHPSVAAQEQETGHSAQGRSSMPSVSLWMVCASALYGLYTAVHKLLAVYQRRRRGYSLLQYVSSEN